MRQEGLFPERTLDEIETLLAPILERFGGTIIAVAYSDLEDTRTVWIETVRPKAARRRRYQTGGPAGHPIAEQIPETILLGKFGGYGKPERRGSSQPWRLVWSKSGEPLEVGLFTSKELADSWRKRR
jgi:hypothetical protein